MPRRLDYGRLMLTQESDGTTSLTICDSIISGQAQGISAQYSHVPAVRIGRDVRLRRAGNQAETVGTVEVDGREPGVIRVRGISAE
jgi:hypothetical protein